MRGRQREKDRKKMIRCMCIKMVRTASVKNTYSALGFVCFRGIMVSRSEERRGGNECRSRGEPDH